MKQIRFSKHAILRLERIGLYKTLEKNMGPAMRLLRNAEKLYIDGRGITTYRRGVYRFIVKETDDRLKVITIIKDD